MIWTRGNKPTEVVRPTTASGLREIIARQVSAITDLAAGHPVFKVTFSDGTDLVLKSESGSGGESIGRYNTLSDLMSTVSDVAKSEALSPKENAQLKLIRVGSPYFKQAVGMVGNDAFFVKMPFTNGLKDAQKAGFGGTFSLAQMATLAALMPKLVNNKNAWVSMGEVLMIDQFVGNGDRAWWTGTQTQLMNPGNIFFKTDNQGNIERTVGLDNFDPFAGAAGRLYGTDITDWANDFGAVLKSNRIAMQFATGLVAEFVKHAASAQVVVKLGRNEATWFAAGFEQAEEKLKKKLKTQATGGKGMPSGVMARAKWLGWIK